MTEFGPRRLVALVLGWLGVSVAAEPLGCASKPQAGPVAHASSAPVPATEPPSQPQRARSNAQLQSGDLALLIGSLPPWTTCEAFGPDEWRRYFEVARVCQQQSDDAVACALQYNALAVFAPGTAHPAEWDPDSVPYILLRIMFVGPETTPIKEVYNKKGWLGLTRDDFLGWPVRWIGERPALASDYQGSMGPPYDAASEYLDFRSRYPFRQIGP